MQRQAGTSLLLLGAGHGHLEVLRRLANRRRRHAGAGLIVVSPGDFWYSGLATGMLGGMYPPQLDCVPVRPLVERAGGTYVQGVMEQLDVRGRCVHLTSGRRIDYDIVSLNLGSETPPLPGQEQVEQPGQPQSTYSLKPLELLHKLRQDMEMRFAAGGQAVRIIVAGGGASACEIAANLLDLAGRRGGSVEICLLVAGPRVLEQFTPAVADTALAWLRGRGVEVHCTAPVERVEPNEVVAAGRRFPFDVLVNATGLKPPTILRSIGLPVNEEGALLVDDHLRSIGDDRVFGTGDCIAMTRRDLPKIGVYAVRQAPVLAHNLLAALGRRPLRRYRPQKRFLLVLNLGEATGLATWGSWSWQGRGAMRLKDWLDRRFLRRLRGS